MNDERWQNIISMVKEKFSPAELSCEDIEIGQDKHNNPVKGKIERVEFTGPLGKMKLERTTKPKVLDKHTLYSNRAGSDMRVDYVYSEDEVVQFMNAYKWDEEEEGWIEIEASSLAEQ
ncbi:hypothetical protein KKD19_00345 [Patescibacteria group bacterium]|nr:hypothetical protein [Patescibacteria group bacterium]MBU4511681.1 hypothetical protein [Patescibacteria group bacterium]